MKVHKMPDGALVYDLGQEEGLVVLEPKLAKQVLEHIQLKQHGFSRLDYSSFDKIGCGGFSSFTTKKNRKAYRLEAPVGLCTHYLEFSRHSGDHTWGGWNRRKPVGYDCLALAVATSRGGGCWFELTVVRASGYKTAEQAEIEEELS